MKLSTRTKYGVRAILELAENRDGGPLQLRVIAKRQGLSVKYLEQLMATLKVAGFVRGIRGAKGGYILAKAANKIKLSDVFTCLEGPVITSECVENDDYCLRASDCVAREVWKQVQDAVKAVLESTTLQGLVDRAKGKESLDYQI